VAADSDGLPDYLGPEDLAALGLTAEDLRRCPWATELAGLDGRPCWARDDVRALLDAPRGPTS
jgi:hypothetical protein